MKKIAIFCDGTWNDYRMTDLTNVSRLAKCVADYAADGVTQQITFYEDGVGVGAQVDKLTDTVTHLMGGGLGDGLDYKIEVCYRFLVSNYAPGDEIYIFGFSRGAYTARSLVGLIRKCGILRRQCMDKIPQAIDTYRNRTKPNQMDSVQFRQTYAHDVATGTEEYSEADKAECRASNQSHAQKATADIYQYRPSRSLRLMYVGLWDTVGSLGVPQKFSILSKLVNAQYDFHDTDATSLIASLRHAVAIDEKRRVFGVTPVDNIDSLNEEWAQVTGFDIRDESLANFVPYDWRPYQQQWFPGDHGSVGGGNPQHGLSSCTLLWIAEGAVRAGLNLLTTHGNELDYAARHCEPRAPWLVNKDGTSKVDGRDFLGDVGGYRPRKGPERMEQLGWSARDKWCVDGAYRPNNLYLLKGMPCPPPVNNRPPPWQA